MRIRGERECAECGRRWSYYETGAVTCPACGSVQSVGLDEERRLHTDSPAELDLTPARLAVDDRPLGDVATIAEERARDYLLDRGFVRGGELGPLDDTYVAAAELRHAAAGVKRMRDPDDAAEAYFLALLEGADKGVRPPAVSVPESLRWARGLAAAKAVEAYRRDVIDWLDDHPDPSSRSVHETLGQHGTRIGALDGDVDPSEADRVITAAQEFGDYLTEESTDALVRAEERLASLS